jgi:hypothetical protein
MVPTPTLARRFWHAVEPIHATVYFAPEPAEAAAGLGLRGFWMGYFAGRIAPLGPIPSQSVTAMTFGFSPTMVDRALPAAWSYTDPDAMMASRIEAVTAALKARLGGAMADLAELNELLSVAISGCRFDARPLAAAWSAVPVPADPVGALWLATTVLREHRGDGHVLAAVSLGLRGLDATVTHAATGAIDEAMVLRTRGWTDQELAQSVRRLQARGLLDRDGRLTKTGGAQRRELEEITDRLASGPVEVLGETGIERAIELATPLAHRLFDTGVIPVPNPIGLPRL